MKVEIEWYCGRYVGPSVWQYSGDWIKEPYECGNTFKTDEELDDFNKEACSTVCPACGQTLTQWDDEPRRIQ
jgi:hypothetical protein